MLSHRPISDAASEAALLPMPVHVAIIMDGNGRWAKQRRLPRVMGHRKGADSVRSTVKTCGELGVAYLTLFAFSSENWKRPIEEIDDLMGLLRHYIRHELNEIHKNNVCLRCIGDRRRLPADVVELIANAEARTRDNTGLTLVLALNYGAKMEILDAVRAIGEAVQAGEMSPQDIDETVFCSHLQTAGIPDPDIIIRTSGEQRLSNFLLWQAAYSELMFVPDFWPDFDREKLVAAISEYRCRDRRYGARNE
ncbi:MAG: isoprenyl transferase [Sphingomonadales bacterium]